MKKSLIKLEIIRDELTEIGVTKDAIYVSGYLNKGEAEEFNKVVSRIIPIINKLIKKYHL